MITFVEHLTINPCFYYILMKFGEKITQLKKAKNLSQIALAEATGISRDAISKYERGDAVPSVEYAKRIADVLGVSLDYLAGDEDKEEVLDNEAVKRIKEIQKLPILEKEKIYSVVDALIRDHKTKKAYS
jgi:transcriptional regulator with XRE-family HTH domain